MSLRDHFHPPLSERRHWDSFHGAWAEAMAMTLNGGMLPPHYVAEARVKLGRSLEIDVGTLDEGGSTDGKNGNGVAVWSPPKPLLRAALTVAPADIFEVQVFDDTAGPRLVAAVELVSPANKDRPAHRAAFAIKCASYLHDNVNLVVLDVVTTRRTDLHRELLDLLQVAATDVAAPHSDLYAAAYRTLASEEELILEAWREPLTLGAPMPQVPLWITPELCLPLDLEATYEMACVARRIT
jgi:hypothetical protein